MSYGEAFHDVDFPLPSARGASVTIERLTEVVELRSGFEERNAVWSQGRRRYDAGPLVRSRHDLRILIAFFEARLGRLYAFRFRDPLDHASRDDGLAPDVSDQRLGTGDGQTSRFPLVKRYEDSAGASERRIALPVEGSVKAAVGGAPGVFSVQRGEIVFAQPPAPGLPVTAGFLFDVPVRFDTDSLEVTLDAAGAGEAGAAPLIETRLDR